MQQWVEGRGPAPWPPWSPVAPLPREGNETPTLGSAPALPEPGPVPVPSPSLHILTEARLQCHSLDRAAQGYPGHPGLPGHIALPSILPDGKFQRHGLCSTHRKSPEECLALGLAHSRGLAGRTEGRTGTLHPSGPQSPVSLQWGHNSENATPPFICNMRGLSDTWVPQPGASGPPEVIKIVMRFSVTFPKASFLELHSQPQWGGIKTPAHVLGSGPPPAWRRRIDQRRSLAVIYVTDE